MVVLDAKTGEILGMSGGYLFCLQQFNCATQAFRQPGSAFKPFVYAAALENGFEPHSVVVEKPTTFFYSGMNYTPHNYNKDSYGGPMTLYDGLTRSRNVLTAILADEVGVQKIVKLSKQLGIADYFPEKIHIALGSVETTVLKLVSAYASFFNGGYAITPTLFLNITNYFGTEKTDIKNTEGPVIISQKTQEQMKNMLLGCVAHGTGRSLSDLMQNFPITLYGKTGTSNDFKDAWFVGGIELKGETSPHNALKPGHPLVFGIFVGYPKPKSLGLHSTGAKVAIPAIRYFVEKLCEPIRRKRIEPEQTEDETENVTDELFAEDENAVEISG
jgi:penicillin-binding protein 1A